MKRFTNRHCLLAILASRELEPGPRLGLCCHDGTIDMQLARKHRPTKDHAAFKAEIVVVARRLFVEKGFEGTLMDDVASVLRVSKPTVYEKFASKQHLFEAVVESAMLDFDVSWVATAARREVSFAAFMDRVAAEIMMTMSSPKRYELLRLLMRDGALIRCMSASLFERMHACLVAHWDNLIASAMLHGECRKMEPAVARRLLMAPFVHAVFHYTVLGEDLTDIETTEGFLEESYRKLGDSLVLKTAA